MILHPLRLLLLACPLLAAVEGPVVPIAGFDQGADGFDGAVEAVAAGGRGGGGCARLRNPAAEGWVEGGRDVAPAERDLRALRLWARCARDLTLAVRLTDSTGQEFQHRVRVAAGDWRRLAVRPADPPEQRWGGADDGRWHGPLKRIHLVLEGGANEVLVDAIEAELEDRLLPGRLSAAIDLPGHIAAPGQGVAVRLAADAEAVAWEARDWRGAPVGAGTVALAAGAGELRPPASSGYYTLLLRARRGGATVAETATAYAVVPPAPALRDARFGAMTHFAQGWDADLLPLLARIGIASVRDEHYWDEVETEPGRLAFGERSVRWMEACARAGIEPLVAMTFGNRHYDGGKAPASEAGRAAYARYGEAILDRFGDQLKAIEVWNEYNGSWCGGEAEKDRPRFYAEMIKAAYPRLKARRPGVAVLGGAAVLLPPPWFEGIFAHGALAAMDAVVIHPYRRRPEGIEREVAELQGIIRRHNGGRDKPIWVTETGAMPAPKAWPWERGLGLDEQARADAASYLVRQYALLLSTGTVERIYWYLARDYGEFRLMGLLRDPADRAGRYAVAAPYVAYATVIRELAGLAPRGLAAVGRPVYLAEFAGGGREARVAWSTLPARLRLRAAAPLTVVDLAGAERRIVPVDGAVELALDQEPLFVRGACTAAALAAGSPRVLAESSSDFARSQGAGGWSYGWQAGAEGAFTPLAVEGTLWGESWRGGAEHLAIDADAAHPGVRDGRPLWAVRRWTSPAAGRLRLIGSCHRDGQGDGSGLRIRVDGREVHALLVGGPDRDQDAAFDVAVEVRAGASVDFALTPGPGADASYDGTGFSVAVVAAP